MNRPKPLYLFTTPEVLETILMLGAVNSNALGFIIVSTNDNLSRDVWHKFQGNHFSVNDGYSVRISLDGDRIARDHDVKVIDCYVDDRGRLFDIIDGQIVLKSDQPLECAVKSLVLANYIKRIDLVHDRRVSDELHQALLDKLTQLKIPHELRRKFVSLACYDQEQMHVNENKFVLIYPRENDDEISQGQNTTK